MDGRTAKNGEPDARHPPVMANTVPNAAAESPLTAFCCICRPNTREISSTSLDCDLSAVKFWSFSGPAQCYRPASLPDIRRVGIGFRIHRLKARNTVPFHLQNIVTHRVAASDNSDATSLRQARKTFSHLHRASSEFVELEDSHWAVPHLSGSAVASKKSRRDYSIRCHGPETQRIRSRAASGLSSSDREHPADETPSGIACCM